MIPLASLGASKLWVNRHPAMKEGLWASTLVTSDRHRGQRGNTNPTSAEVDEIDGDCHTTRHPCANKRARITRVVSGSRRLPCGRYLPLSFYLFPMSENKPSENITFHLTIKRIEELPRRSYIRSPTKRKWYATVSAGTFSAKTRSQVRGLDGNVTWEHDAFKITTSNELAARCPKISIYRAHDIQNDEKVAVAEEFDPIMKSLEKEFSIKLHDAAGKEKSHGSLVISVRAELPETIMGKGSLGVTSAIELRKTLQAPANWQSFLRSFQQAVELARQISELHTTAKVAVGAVSFAVTALVKQLDRDTRVEELREMMTSLLAFFKDVETLKKNAFLRGVLDRLLCQVSECTYFVCQYQEIESFVQRAAIHLANGTDDIIKQFSVIFRNLTAELTLGTSLQTAINTEYILNKVNDIDVFLHIGLLEHLWGSNWRLDKQCPPDSRPFTINKIQKWVSSCQEGLFILTGPLGSGKSAIMHRVAGNLDSTRRLGACVFLNEHTEGKRTADMVMRTVLYYLARSNPCLGKKIASAIAQHPSLDTGDAARYAHLLEEVGRDLVLYGPVLVAIDGLHELDTPEDAVMILTLLRALALLSQNKLRFLVTLRTGSSLMTAGDWAWEIGDLQSSPELERRSFIQDRLFSLQISGCAFSPYPADRMVSLLEEHSLGSMEWVSLFFSVMEYLPELLNVESFICQLFSSQPPLTDADALARLRKATQCTLYNSAMYGDFLHLAQTSSIFLLTTDGMVDWKRPESTYSAYCLADLGILFKVSSYSPGVGIYAVEPTLHQVFSLLADHTLEPMLGYPSAKSMLQVCLRTYMRLRGKEVKTEAQEPVFLRTLVDSGLSGDEVHQFLDVFNSALVRIEGFPAQWAEASNSWIEKLLAKAPAGGCEWIVYHDTLISHETYEAFTLTTPPLSQSVLDRIALVGVHWKDMAFWARLSFLRHGSGEAVEAERCWPTSWIEVVSQGDDVKLVKQNGRHFGIRPGDRLQVQLCPWPHSTPSASPMLCCLALALKY